MDEEFSSQMVEGGPSHRYIVTRPSYFMVDLFFFYSKILNAQIGVISNLDKKEPKLLKVGSQKK